MSPEEHALRRFAHRYGFEHGLLAGDDPYRIEGAGREFTGAVTRIRVTRNGRFGNIFFQLLHAAWLARQIGYETIEAFAFDGGPDAARVEAGGLEFLLPPAPPPAVTGVLTLTGHFFNAYPFESALRVFPPDAAWDLVRTTMRPLFRHIWDGTPLVGADTLVVHFRAGDVFSGGEVSPVYVQPPASYYRVAIAHARAAMGIRDVRLVFEDRSNPAVAATEAWLHVEQIPFQSQSGDLTTDAATLASATHIVASVSTLAEVAAMLSQPLRSYFAFRHIESHDIIHRRIPPLVAGILQRKGVRLLVISDRYGTFIRPATWAAVAEQVKRIVTFPAESLTVGQTDQADESQRDPDALLVRLQGAEAEAMRLRELPMSARRAEDHLKEQLHIVTGQLRRIENSRGQRLFRGIHSIRRALGMSWPGEPRGC